MSAPARYFHTLRHLGWRQIYARLTDRLHRGIVRLVPPIARAELRLDAVALGRISGKAAPGFQRMAGLMATMQPHAWKADAPGALTFLSEQHDVGIPNASKDAHVASDSEAPVHGRDARATTMAVPGLSSRAIDWQFDGAADSALWLFNLHYHDWLWDLIMAGEKRLAVEVMLDWVERNPFGARGCFRGPWHPYTISRRVMNWMAICSLSPAGFPATDDESGVLLQSLREQVCHLARHKEVEHRGNHLMQNLIALEAARVFFGLDGDLFRSRSQFIEEIAEQFPRHGMHAEGSFAYLVQMMMQFRYLSEVCEAEHIVALSAHVRAGGFRFANAIVTRARRFPLLGDTAEDSNDLANSYFCIHEANDKSATEFEQAGGYFVHRSPNGLYVLFDADPIGLKYNGAHMHADLLMVEVHAGAQPIICDGGAGFYRAGPVRELTRAARNHAVVSVAGIDVAEPWASFRTARRGNPAGQRGGVDASGCFAEATSDAFERAGLSHRRRVHVSSSLRIATIVDEIFPVTARRRAANQAPISTYWPLHPELSAEVQERVVSLRQIGSNKVVARMEFGAEDCEGSVEIGAGIYWHAFGKSSPREVVTFTGRFGGECRLVTTIRIIDDF